MSLSATGSASGGTQDFRGQPQASRGRPQGSLDIRQRHQDRQMIDSPEGQALVAERMDAIDSLRSNGIVSFPIGAN